ncbi:class I mannose-6-phosphate isomerase [bacterium]|nr:class I mannose-6-phosphate isomerase [bacterium]
MTEKLYPLTFNPIFKERIWGGRNLERLFGKPVPVEKVIGESWEVSDREGDESVVNQGPLAGVSLRQLVETYGAELVGVSKLWEGRFPLLVKILDAQQKLSLQVHPPLDVASQLGGDPKTEMWFIANCQANSDLYVGLRTGVSRALFEDKIQKGLVAECFHRIAVQDGDALFLPSGRVHAIGSGNVIFEIQQNSDTTYRVHDWDRVGLDGKPRELHIDASLKSIDFDDFEPPLVGTAFHQIGDGVKGRSLADCEQFIVDQRIAVRHARITANLPDAATVMGVVKGRFACQGNGVKIEMAAGEFCLLPATVKSEISALMDDSECLLASAR